MPARKEIKITNDTAQLSTVRTDVHDFIRDSGLRADERSKIVLAVDEAISNVIEHAYEDTAGGEIQVVLSLDDEALEILIRDNGKKFEPESIADPDIGEHIRRGKKKGLGMFIMRKIMDDVRYSLESEFQNELVMRKLLPSKKPSEG